MIITLILLLLLTTTENLQACKRTHDTMLSPLSTYEKLDQLHQIASVLSAPLTKTLSGENLMHVNTIQAPIITQLMAGVASDCYSLTETAPFEKGKLKLSIRAQEYQTRYRIFENSKKSDDLLTCYKDALAFIPLTGQLLPVEQEALLVDAETIFPEIIAPQSKKVRLSTE